MGQLAVRAPAPEEIVGLLAHPVRRRLVAALIGAPRSVAELLEAAAGPPREALEQLERLVKAEVVVENDRRYALAEEVFERSVRDAAAARLGPLNDSDTQLLRRYFYRNRLVQIPSEPWALKAVLDLIAEDFQPGETYTEREVNTTLFEWNGDWAALRRLLVDRHYLIRRDGQYWRVMGPATD